MNGLRTFLCNGEPNCDWGALGLDLFFSFGEAVFHFAIGALLVYLSSDWILKFIRRKSEEGHSRMLDVVDITQTIIDGGQLCVRTTHAQTLEQFLLDQRELIEPMRAAADHAYASDGVEVHLTLHEEKVFKKIETLIYSHANTAFNLEAARERLRPIGERRSVVSMPGQLYLYAEKGAEVSKIHVEFVPDAFWPAFAVFSEDPKFERKSVELRMETLAKMRAVYEAEMSRRSDRAAYAAGQKFVLVFPFVAEVIDNGR